MPFNNLAGLSLRDLEYAVSVADFGHFGRAAAHCGVSQAGLSEQIRKLEALLGCPLFERTTRRLTVTRRGEPLLKQAREVVAAARLLVDMARCVTDPLAGELHLGVIATLGPYYVPSVLRDVRARFPDLSLRITEGLTEPLMQAVRDGGLDMLLAALPLDGMASVPLFFEPFRAVLPTGHALCEWTPLRLRDLAGDGLLLLEEGHCLRDHALSLCGMAAPDGEARFASSLEMLRHMIAAGEGHSLLPHLAADGRPELGGLVRIRELETHVGRTIGLAWRGSDPRGDAFRTLAGFLREVAPDGTRPVLTRAA